MNASPAVAEIPDLKEKKKERRKGGVIWGSGADGAALFEGARGAQGVAGLTGDLVGPGARMGGGFFARLFPGLVSLIARLAATSEGRMAMAVVALAIIGGLAMLAKSLMSSAAAPVAAATSSPELPPIPSSIRVRAPEDQGLGYAAKASNGMIQFARPQNSPEVLKAAESGKAGEAGQTPDAGATALSQPTESGPLTPNSTDFAGQSQHIDGSRISANLGGVLQGTQSAMFRSGFDFGKGIQGKLSAFPQGVRNGVAGALARSVIRGTTRMNLGRRGLVSSGAFGQATFAALQNAGVRYGGSTATETNAAIALQQFSGAHATGGVLTSPTDLPGGMGGGANGSAGSGVVTPPGSGYSCTNAQTEAGGIEVNGQCVVCAQGAFPDPSGNCVATGQQEGAPFKAMLDQGKALVDKATMLILLASILVMLGWTLFGIGASDPYHLGYLMPIGLGLVALGIMIAMMAYMIGGQVQALGDRIAAMGGLASTYGDKVNGLGGDIKIGAILAMTTGVGGLFMYFKIKSKSETLYEEVKKEIDAIEKSHSMNPGTGGGTSGTNTDPNDIRIQ
ncbi:MAG: hypothetical protein HY077_07510 [Elusimicrobia bacterium]|nr:hypothetical protein [Elusimicrobiota bacterium]